MRCDVTRLGGGVVLLALALGTGCTEFEERVLYKVPIFSNMHEAPSFDPYEMPLPPPPGSVPFLSPAGTVLPPLAARDDSLNAFAAGPNGVNPLDSADPAVLALGQVMYDRHCFVCHGAQGLGDGPILNKPGEMGRFPIAPNLTLPVTVARADGYLYGVIRAGRGLMPSYGPRTTHLERWAMVSYLRQVIQQGAAAAPAQQDTTAAAGTAAPATQDSAAAAGAATTGGEER